MADQSQTNRMSLEYDWSYISNRMPDMVKKAVAMQFLFNFDIINLTESGPRIVLLKAPSHPDKLVITGDTNSVNYKVGRLEKHSSLRVTIYY